MNFCTLENAFLLTCFRPICFHLTCPHLTGANLADTRLIKEVNLAVDLGVQLAAGHAETTRVKKGIHQNFDSWSFKDAKL